VFALDANSPSLKKITLFNSYLKNTHHT